MTPDKAADIARANGCKWYNDGLPLRFIARRNGRFAYYTQAELANTTEADFIASLPDKRD